MKKFLVIASAICTLLCTACSAENTSVENTESNVALANTNTEEFLNDSEPEDSETSSEDDISSLPDKSNFEIASVDVYDSFNYVIEATKKVYPEGNGKRYYGYLGKKKINDKDCYAFSIYDENDGKHTEVATVAIETKNCNMYVLDTLSGKYENLVIPDDESTESETSWADKETASFEKYLSSGQVKEDKVSSRTEK